MKISELIQNYPSLKVCEEEITRATDAIIQCYKNGGKVLICGNGGSSADSGHIVGELMKGFLKMRPISNAQKTDMTANYPEFPEDMFSKLQGSLPAINLTENSVIISAFANDVDPDMSYAQQVLGYADKGDILIGISTSGNAKNVANAVKVARAKGAGTIGLTGKDGGALKSICDTTIVVPQNETYKIQELHLPVYHYICAAVEAAFYNE